VRMGIAVVRRRIIEVRTGEVVGKFVVDKLERESSESIATKLMMICNKLIINL
jgi:phosphoribosylformylglycinamidine (FGAM) synthase PurS component